MSEGRLRERWICGERKAEGSRTLKRDLELERGLLSGLEFNFVVGSVLILFFSSRIKNYQ